MINDIITLAQITEHWIEIVGTIVGLIYIFFSIRQNILLWFFGIVSGLLLVYQFYISKAYANMAVNAYYIVISIYGWYYWKHGQNEHTKNEQIQIKYSTTRQKTAIILAIVILWGSLMLLLQQTDADFIVALFDAFTSAIFIVATWMLTRKLIENWLFFIVANLIATWLNIHLELFFFAFLYAVYTILAYIGYREWKKERRN